MASSSGKDEIPRIAGILVSGQSFYTQTDVQYVQRCFRFADIITIPKPGTGSTGWESGTCRPFAVSAE